METAFGLISDELRVMEELIVENTIIRTTIAEADIDKISNTILSLLFSITYS